MDAVVIAQPTDTITQVDLLSIAIFPGPVAVSPAGPTVYYRLQETWASGKITQREGVVGSPNFLACIASFCQATPKKKLLTWLAANGYEPNLAPA
jgi:hypothetical protein